MSLKCLFGHQWKGCKCKKCGKTQDVGHNYVVVKGMCVEKCSICGKESRLEHQWKGCKCERCGRVRDESHDFDLCAGKCRKCEKVCNIEHDWKSVEGKKKCLRCDKEKIPAHYVVIALSNCTNVDEKRIQGLNDMLIQEYKNEPLFSNLINKEWQDVRKILTHPTPEFNVMRAALEWIAGQVGMPPTNLVEEQDKKLFVIRTPVPIGPSLWVVAHYFYE